MTQDEIIEMARQAGFFKHLEPYYDETMLEAFAKLVAAKEREECAKVADDADKYNRHISREIALAIRARGEA